MGRGEGNARGRCGTTHRDGCRPRGCVLGQRLLLRLRLRLQLRRVEVPVDLNRAWLPLLRVVEIWRYTFHSNQQTRGESATGRTTSALHCASWARPLTGAGLWKPPAACGARLPRPRGAHVDVPADLNGGRGVRRSRRSGLPKRLRLARGLRGNVRGVEVPVDLHGRGGGGAAAGGGGGGRGEG